MEKGREAIKNVECRKYGVYKMGSVGGKIRRANNIVECRKYGV